MVKKLVFLFFLITFLCFQAKTQITISEAKSMSFGSSVTIRGVITSDDKASNLRFMQDETAGIALYDGSSGSESVQNLLPGYEVEITGTLGQYNGLIELDFIEEVIILNENAELPNPLKLTIAELSSNLYQSMLIEIDCADFISSGSFSDGSYDIEDNTGIISAYVTSNSDVVGLEIPDGRINLSGILSFYNQPQILIPSNSFEENTTCLYFLTKPQVSNFTKNSIEISFQLNGTANALLKDFNYDFTNLNTYALGNGTSFVYEITNYEPGNIYHFEVSIENEALIDTLVATTISNSSGEIEVYFNNPVADEFSNGSNPTGDSASELNTAILQLISDAKATIDIAMYNNNQTWITDALENAHNNGIIVRYIADGETTNSALDNLSFPILKDNQPDLMHNKFIIVDADFPEAAKVVSGSTNFTWGQMNEDPNNLIVIQDQSLAKAYRMEFEEMWGSDTSFPNPLKAKFGAQKKDNTPHVFLIGGRVIESYFSPSDQTSIQIKQELLEADNSILFGLLTFTYNDLGDAIAEKSSQGISVRGIIENIDDPGSEYQYLNNMSIPVAPHTYNHLFHHKYAMIDEGYSNATTITGSHNWTFTAETGNDENTLIIHDESITNMYRQEFEQRWKFVSPSEQVAMKNDLIVAPNVTSGFFYLHSKSTFEKIELLNVLGVATLRLNGNVENRYNISNVPAGKYYIIAETIDGLLHLSSIIKI